MKKLSLVLILMLVSIIGLQAQKTYGLIVGVGKYGRQGISDLTYTIKDAKELHQVFKNQGIVASMLTSKYATKEKMLEKLEQMVSLAKPEDKIYFVFSGHGTRGHIVLYGGEFVPYSALTQVLSKAKTKHVYCFVDACHSGSVANVLGAGAFTGTAPDNQITFLVSCREDETSVESGLIANGYFTQALVAALRGKADKKMYAGNDDRQITVAETYKFVYNDVVRRCVAAGVKEEERRLLIAGDKAGLAAMRSFEDYTPEEIEQLSTQHPQLFGPSDNFTTVLARW